MARTHSTVIFKWIAAVIGVVVVGIGAGYVLGGMHPTRSVSDVTAVQQPAVPAPAPAARTSSPPPVAPRHANGDYTAPGAPRIRILEEKTPSVTDATARSRTAAAAPQADTTTDIPTPDVEASQAAAQPENQQAAPPSSFSGLDTPSGSNTPAAGDSSASPPPSDGDYERVGNRADSEASQADGGEAGSPGRKAQFRVQTGAFENGRNARALADTLRGQGYSASTRTERQDGRTLYRVQVGAYRSRSAADKAAQDFSQRSGYPAYVTPVSP